MMYVQIIVCIIIVAGFNNGNQASADIIDRMVAIFNGSPSSSFLGERHELKIMATNRNMKDEELFNLSTQDIIDKAGFVSRSHVVTTSDGYITELINIVNPLADKRRLIEPPVLLFHGALLDASSWIASSIRQHHPEKYPRNLDEDGPITSSNRSLAFMLANNGFDVWLTTTRGGNKQNMGHTRFRTELLDDLLHDLYSESADLKARKFIDTLKYLDFSQDPLVEIEYPKQIDEVIRLTRSRKVSVITYSKATQIVFKILASDPVHSRRIHSHVAIAPILNDIGTSNFWKILSKVAVNVPNPVGNVIYSQILASFWTRRVVAWLDPRIWFHLFTTLTFGPSPKYQTSSELSFIGHLLTGESFTEAKHYQQQIRAGKLQKYDYGKEINRLVYDGLETPPEYDITSIKLKRWMMVSGGQDVLGTPDSSQKYFDLQPFKPDRWIKLAKYNHLDLVFALDNDVKTNLPILEFMEKFKTVELSVKGVDVRRV